MYVFQDFAKNENFICKNHHTLSFLLKLYSIAPCLLFQCQILHCFFNLSCYKKTDFLHFTIVHQICYKKQFFEFFLYFKVDLQVPHYFYQYSILISMNFSFIHKLVFYFFKSLFLVFLFANTLVFAFKAQINQFFLIL